ncbi:MAG: hypothetical protein A2441_03485 [Candidatus Veblenbacteria bacterium RIFOXYC2_FULL_42_11]|uniref:Phosphoribosyl-ATP pyrophosphohydrolase n=1 Tax=Candidatus Veblenbacteria bacterium RIFOXYC2_FULL_42_11 TaxID=1802428 RepID=A0A1G2Q761_9BACT|nr:MAG: hypothetical protein A2441_03485 [Candidatus Veblenbacteria bacterium RIFOXYC2_FULL_42_11]
MESELQPERITYNKIVRDKVVAHLTDLGKEPESIEVGPEEALELLKQKLIEEAQEVASADSNKELIRECGDLQEVLDTVIKYAGVDPSIVSAVRKEKFENRGGFDKPTKLISSLP